jgi:PAS domain S-box-containing protein
MIIDNAQYLFALQSIFEGMEDAVITHDLQGSILNCNPAAEQMFGLSAGELYGKSIYILIPDELHAEQTRILEQAMNAERVPHFTTIRMLAGQQPLPVSITASPVKNDKGEIIGISQIIRDNAAEREFEAKQGILAAIIDDSEDAIISKTLHGYITSWNKGAETIFGYTPDEVIGQHITILIPDERLGEEDNILGNIRQGNKIEHFETFRKAKSGNLIPISLTVSPIKNKAGQIIGVSKIARNISHKRMAEERQAILASIVENSDDAIISKNLNGIISSWNKGAERIFGYNEEEVIGRHISFIIPSDRIDEETEILKNIRAGITVDHFQTIRLTKDGKLIDISLTVSPLKDVEGKVVGASKVARDITAEKLAQAIIKESNQKKDEFIAMASHELKTPLTSMSGYLQLLAMKVTDSNSLFVEKVIKQQEKLNALVNDLFDISKIQSGRLGFSVELFDIGQLIMEIVEPMKEANSNHEIMTELSPGLIIEGDKMRLEQGLANLITNAIKYSPDGGRIEILAELREPNLHFSVKDNGMGIEQEKLGHIFNQFYRVDPKDRRISGMGLGLYITKEIIERHGGKIQVKSELGKGSEFTFNIPVRQQPTNNNL